MGDTTHISWCDSTFNPFIGCTKVSPACDGCYAEALMGVGGRYGRAEWGAPGKGAGTRVRTSEANWKKPLAWNRAAEKAGTNPYVFCASLADVFDNEVPAEWRRDLFDLIRKTPNLTWLLLTKRPQNIVKLFGDVVGHGEGSYLAGETVADHWPRNAAIGCTVVAQEEADRDVPKLLAAKAALKPAFAFVSMEPLLGPVDLSRFMWPVHWSWPAGMDRGEAIAAGKATQHRQALVSADAAFLDWVITGGETDQGGHKARPQNPDWFRSLRDQCVEAGVPFHHKQNGEWVDEMTLPDDVPSPGEAIYLAPGNTRMVKIGKKRAGRLLDGVEHNARPT